MSLTVSIFQRPISKNMYKLEISKKSQQSEAAKLITKMIMLHHIFLIDIKKHFLQMIYISRYKKKWSFSQTKVKVDNNPKSRFFLVGLKYTIIFCVFNFFVEFLSWTEKYFCTAKNLTKTVLTQNMSSRILYILTLSLLIQKCLQVKKKYSS